MTGSAILAAFFGAFVFGRIADILGRKTVYTVVAAFMIVGALTSAFATGFVFLVVARFILGLGIGGDYPVSAVLMSEYSNRHDRGRLVGLVFSMQALGLIVGPLVALVLICSGISHDLTWRILLGLGAVPAAAVIYLRARMPESPRFQARVQDKADKAAVQLHRFAEGAIDTLGRDRRRGPAYGTAPVPHQPPHAHPPPRHRWHVVPFRLRLLRQYVVTSEHPQGGGTGRKPGHQTVLDACHLHDFRIARVLMAVARMDRIGHRRLQFIGFAVMAIAFLVLGAVPVLTTALAPFLAIFGLSYFFIEFGPNTTTFVLPSEVYPVSMRTTGHGIAAGIGKLGAFIGVFLVPQLQKNIGLRGMLLVAGGAAVLGYLLTTVLPEPARRTLEEVSGEDDGYTVVLPVIDFVPNAAMASADLVPVADPVPVP